MMSTFSSTDDKNTERNETLNATNARTCWGQFWSILRMSFWKNKNIAIVAAIMMLVALPLLLVVFASRMEINDLDQYFSHDLNELIRQLILYCILPISAIIMILGASQMFSFLHQRPALDVYHALPVKRRCMFIGRFTAGFLLVLIPQMIATAVTCLLALLPTFALLNVGQIIQMVLLTILMSLAFYAVCCLSFVLTGTFLDAMFMLLLLNIAGPATIYTVETFVSMTLPGFTMTSGSILSQLFLFSPLGMLFVSLLSPMDLFHILWWVMLIVLMTLGSLLVYQRRRSELAGKPFAYRLPFTVLRFLACIIIGLIFGYLFERQYRSLTTFILGALIGSLVTHVLIEAILSRGFSGLRKSIKSYLLFIVIFSISCLMVSTGFFGFDTRMPAVDQIERVELIGVGFGPTHFADGTMSYPSFSEPANQALVLEIHQNWLKEMQLEITKPYTFNTQESLRASLNGIWTSQFTISYKLKSGLEMIRTIYPDFSKEPYASLLKELRYSREYSLHKYAFFLRSNNTLLNLVMKTKAGQPVFDLSSIQDNDRLDKIKTALQKDLLANADNINNSQTLGYLNVHAGYEGGSFSYSTNQTSIQLTEAYSNTITVLNEYNLLKDLNTLNEQISSAYLAVDLAKSDYLSSIYQSNPNEDYIFSFTYITDGTKFEPYLNDEEVFLKIDNVDMVRTLYNSAKNTWASNQKGYFLLLAKDGQVLADGQTYSELPVLFVPADQMPSEVTALINK